MRHPLLALSILAATGLAAAGTTLGDRTKIVEALKAVPACCVVDARGDGPRRLRPLKDALPWDNDLRIVPSGTVVVVADSDRTALAIGRRIEARFKAKDVIAVKGGFDTWREVLNATQEPGMPATFVIPKNTCEQGTPLQILRSNKR